MVRTDRETFEKAVKKVLKAVTKRPVSEIDSCLLLQTDGGRLTITGTGAEMTVKAMVPADGGLTAPIAVNADKLCGFVSKMDGCGDVSLEENGGNGLFVKGGRLKTLLPAFDITGWREIRPGDGQDFQMEADARELKQVVDETAHCLGPETNQLMGSVSLQCADGHVSATTLDGRRISMRGDTSNGYPLLIKGQYMHDIANMFDGQIRIRAVAGIQATFESDDVRVHVMQTPGIYFNVANMLSASRFGHYVEFDRAELTNALEAGLLFYASVTFDIGRQGTKVTVRHSSGDFEALLGTDADTECRISFNAKYLLDAIRTLGAEKVRLCFDGPGAPAMIRDEDAGATEVVLPVIPSQA